MHRTETANVLVIGTGAAGWRAAIAATQAGAQARMLGKRPQLDAHTVLASGGINAALGTRDPEDSPEQHFVDTWREGYFLGNPRMIEIMARESPAIVRELADWGCEFARTPDGDLDQRYFGAHRWRRTCYAGDFTGRAIQRTVARRGTELGIRVEEDQYVSRLLVADGACFGALAFDLHTGERTVHLADAVVLATGGHTRLWRRSSSRRDENYGDGLRLALDAGCRLMDMELVQFHPTGMVHPEEAAGTLVTEAVRGEGGVLRNALGERYMERYDPERLELSSRDRVSLANYTEIVEGRGGPHAGVFLDISHRPKAYIADKLPRMYRQFIEWQMLDISREPMEVAPTAHYSMGGIVVDPETHATDVPGLYAAGECVGGLHGANRLGGNSLGEALISGKRAGEAAATFSLEREVFSRSRRAIDEALRELDELTHPGEELGRPLQRRVRDLMWEKAGVVRTEDGLRDGLRELASIRDASGAVDVRPGAGGWTDLAHALDLRAGLVAAEATLRSAIERRETRGAQIRADYPELDPSLQVNIHHDARMEPWTVPVPPVPDELREWAEGPLEVGAERLLE
jgi:succinate dehydrogenase / fumarate reductase flavoprotein subunit